MDMVNSPIVTVNLNSNTSSLSHCILKWAPRPAAVKEYQNTSLVLALAVDEKASSVFFCISCLPRSISLT